MTSTSTATWPTITARARTPGDGLGEVLETDGEIRTIARRAAIGLALSMAYGAALGIRSGSVTGFLLHTLGVPVGVTAVAGLGVPSLFIALSMAAVPIDARQMASATARAIALDGVVLAGLAPTMALFVVTTDTPIGAALVAASGLALASVIALGDLVRRVARAARETSELRYLASLIAIAIFGLFTIALALRLGALLLPILLGASS